MYSFLVTASQIAPEFVGVYFLLLQIVLLEVRANLVRDSPIH